MKVAATHEAGWEKIMAQGSQNSFKDEWLVGLFSIPLILSFCGEWGRTIVAEGFAALETMPDCSRIIDEFLSSGFTRGVWIDHEVAPGMRPVDSASARIFLA